MNRSAPRRFWTCFLLPIVCCLVIGIAAGCDADMDGIPDNEDNCPSTPNPDQADQDGDATGDACEIPGDGAAVPLSGETQLRFTETSFCEEEPGGLLGAATAEQSATFDPQPAVSTTVHAEKGQEAWAFQQCDPVVYFTTAGEPSSDPADRVAGTITCRVRHEGTAANASQYGVFLLLSFGPLGPDRLIAASDQQDSDFYEFCSGLCFLPGSLPGGPYQAETATLTIPDALFDPGREHALQLTTSCRIMSSSADPTAGGMVSVDFFVEDCRVTFPG